MGRRIHRRPRKALGLFVLLTVLSVIVAACGGESGDIGKVSPVINEVTSVEQGPTDAQQEPTPKKVDEIGADSSAKRSEAVLAEIEEKGGWEEYVKYLALQEVDPFWARRFTKWANSQQYETQQYLSGVGSFSYTSARLVVLDKPLETGGCEVASEERGTFYCNLDNTIYFAPKGQLKDAEEHGPFFFTYTIAHEWGHHVQNQLGYMAENQNSNSSNSRAIEDHADCLAGVWVRSYHKRGHLDRRAILEGINLTYAIGDHKPNDGREAYGTPEERVRWFLTGYTSGVFSECSGALR